MRHQHRNQRRQTPRKPSIFAGRPRERIKLLFVHPKKNRCTAPDRLFLTIKETSHRMTELFEQNAIILKQISEMVKKPFR